MTHTGLGKQRFSCSFGVAPLAKTNVNTEPVMRLIKRLLRRLLIFGLGIFCVWLIVFVIFETADRR